MAEQWISAAQALALAGSPVAICSRAHASLVHARARLLRIGPHRHADMEIPADFWWADGEAALEQDWDAGDFSTWIGGNKHFQAFGVRFAVSGILDLLPPEDRGAAALRLSVAGKTEWLSARDAIKFASDAAPIAREAAPSLITDLCELGFVNARAIEMTVVDDQGLLDPFHHGFREWDVPKEFWIGNTNEQNWEVGNFRGRAAIGADVRRVFLNGVHFRREALLLALKSPDSSTVAPPKAEAAARNPGGRPPAAFNDDLMCAVWARIYRGELIPDRQSTIKDAILDWASNNNHQLGETTAKEKARKIFEACQREGKNP